MRRKGFMLVFVVAFITLISTVPQALASDGKAVTTSDIITLVEQLNDDGQFASERALRNLKMHLTAVNHYEQQEETDKVVEHMNSFKHLLVHQLDKEFISENAYEALMEHTEAVIQRWDDMPIVQNGQANAVIVVPKATEELTDHQIPGWRGIFQVENKVKVVDTYRYSGDYSVHLNDDSDKKTMDWKVT